MRRGQLTGVLAAALVSGVPRLVGAQPGRTQARCNGQPITEVVIRTQAPAFGGWFERSPLASRVVSTLHVTTAPDVIERFVLLKRGEPCNPLRRAETERILRSQPFLADASVTAFADGPNGVRIEVITVDEPSTIVSLGFVSNTPYVRAVTLGQANVAGRGVYALLGWREGHFYRDTWLADYRDYQLLGKPYQLAVHAERRDLGSEWEAETSYPFFSDVQTHAWQLAGGRSRDYIPFRSPGRHTVSLGSERTYFDAGGVVRIGRPGRLGLLGASFSTEQASADGDGVMVTDSGLVPAPTPEFADRYGGYRVARLNALFGFRSITFLPVAGFDALNGRQDVRRGVQAGLTLGTGIPLQGATRDKVYGALDLYAGAGSSVSFAAMQWHAEGRQVARDDRFQDLLMSGRMAWYLRPQSRHTVIAGMEWTAGWRDRTPFQLSLGDRRGGVRGFNHADVGGGRRIVGRLEERWRIGSFRGTADYGLAFFTDAGRLWAGDAALGVDSRRVHSVGMSLLAAIPPRSQRLWRVDLAVPMGREYHSRVELTFGNYDRTRSFWTEPNDVRRNRERSVPASVFNWP